MNSRSALWLALGLGISLAPATPAQPFDKVIDSVMYHEPAVPTPRTIWVFADETKALWLRALARPEADVRLQAARAITRAHRLGSQGMEARIDLESTVDPLLAALDQPDTPPAARLALVQALLELDARKSAPRLLRLVREGNADLRNLIEPVLAKWDHRPARSLWLARLADPGTPRRPLILAIRSLGVVKEEKAVDRLRELVSSALVPTPVRLEAARALGSIERQGLEPEAARLADGPLLARLCAAWLIHQHDSPEAVAVLRRLVRDKEPGVAILAAEHLLKLGTDLGGPDLESLLDNIDGNVRSVGVEMLSRRPDPKHIRLLADRLEDRHPEVRRKARERLRVLAGKEEWQGPVTAEGMRVVSAPGWRGQEQAAILLARLDHKPAAARLLPLLEADRPEVYITAAWGIRKLAVPQTADPVSRYIATLLDRPPGNPGDREGERTPKLLDHQLAQLYQLLGQIKYRPADTLLRKAVPRSGGMGPESRSAAIWSLGWIHEGKPVPALVKALEARLNDINPMNAEDDRVRQMSAIALGLMKAKEAERSLRNYFHPDRSSEDAVANACRWAFDRATGSALPPPRPIRKMRQDYFLLSRP